MLGCAGRRGGAVALVCRIPTIGCRQLACVWCSLFTLKQVMGRGCAHDYAIETGETAREFFASFITSLLAFGMAFGMVFAVSQCVGLDEAER